MGEFTLHLTEQKAKVGIFTPTEWHAGIRTPSVVLDAYPVLHSNNASFVVKPNPDCPLPETDGDIDANYVMDKIAAAVAAELEHEGEILVEDRIKDGSYILNETKGLIQRDHMYKVVAWFVSERPGEISAVWLANGNSVDRATVTTQEPRGHRFKV